MLRKRAVLFTHGCTTIWCGADQPFRLVSLTCVWGSVEGLMRSLWRTCEGKDPEKEERQRVERFFGHCEDGSDKTCVCMSRQVHEWTLTL